MYLSSLTHRERLFELAARWLSDRVEPGDGRFVTEVFIYENLIVAPAVRSFVRDVLRAVHPGPVGLRHLYSKDEVRQAIVDACREPSLREASLFKQLRAHPEEFFPRTPVDMIVASGADGALLGMMRLKRIRRIADKLSRRVADLLSDRIRASATSMAEARAQSAGVPLDALFTDPAVMVEEFAAAERTVAQSFRDGQVVLPPASLRVDDVIGSKFIGSEENLERVEAAIRFHPSASISDRKVHRGDYTDVNLDVDLELPPPELIVERMREQDWSYAANRGLDPRTLAHDFADYVWSGARTIRTEVILTTFADLVESELGRGIHEERILRQRYEAEYTGRIAQNASYIIEYLLKLAISPTVEVSEVPIKMWGRYLSDTLAVAIGRLQGTDTVERLFDSFAPEPPEVAARNTA